MNVDVTTPVEAFGLGWVVILAICGLTAAWLADQKGRRAINWFCAGFLLPPVGLYLIAFAPRGASGSFRACPRCMESVRRRAEICPWCGASFAEPGAGGG